MHIKIKNKCTGCGVCISKCPVGAIEFYTKDYIKKARIAADKCTQCGECIPHCQFNAIVQTA